MENRAERAAELFNQGYNCAQAVYLASADEIGIDYDQAARLTSSLGGGMGRLREVCGAVSGMFLVAGSKYGPTDPNDKNAKARHYQLIQDLARQFREEFGSIICRDLIPSDDASTEYVPSDRTPDFYKRRPCGDYVRFAASLIDRLEQENE